jgi:D-beta-D-heptose 7-phosphate kinase/D-beta-D-heptose 1-phosphate adenosyltransferase
LSLERLERLERLDRIEEILLRFENVRVLVVGDLILDEYREGDVDRVSPEAPVPIVRVSSSTVCLGGAANVAQAVVSMGANCQLVGLVGDDQEGEKLLSLAGELGLSTSGILRSVDRPTTHKLRIVARSQQMLRLDREENGEIGAETAETFRRMIAERIEGCQLIILEDYDKGLFGEGLARWVIELARTLKILIVADPKVDLARFRGVDLVKPNFKEAIRFAPGRASDRAMRRTLLEKLQFELGGGEVVVTRGRFGMSALDREGSHFEVPTRALEVYDVQGAGDTSIAALGLCRAVGASLGDACIVANAAAGIAVEKAGTASVELSELRKRLSEILVLREEDEGES